MKMRATSGGCGQRVFFPCRRVGHVDNVEDDRLMVLCAVHGILCISENSAESWWMVTNSS